MTKRIFGLYAACIVACVLAGCGEATATPGLTPLAVLPATGVADTATVAPVVSATAAVPSSVAASPLPTTDTIVVTTIPAATTAAASAAVPPTPTAAPTETMPSGSPSPAIVLSTPKPGTSGPLTRATLPPATSVSIGAGGLPITATPAYALPTAPNNPPLPGEAPQTPLALPTGGSPAIGDYPTDTLVVVRAFLTALQFDPSGKDSTHYLSGALQTEVAGGRTVLALLGLQAIYTGFAVSGNPDDPNATMVRAALNTGAGVANRTFTLVRESNQWRIGMIKTA